MSKKSVILLALFEGLLLRTLQFLNIVLNFSFLFLLLRLLLYSKNVWQIGFQNRFGGENLSVYTEGNLVDKTLAN